MFENGRAIDLGGQKQRALLASDLDDFDGILRSGSYNLDRPSRAALACIKRPCHSKTRCQALRARRVSAWLLLLGKLHRGTKQTSLDRSTPLRVSLVAFVPLGLEPIDGDCQLFDALLGSA